MNKMYRTKSNVRFCVITAMILIAVMIRLLPHPSNFTPVGAVALFGSAYFEKKYFSAIIPILSLWISDLLLNNIIYAVYFDHFVWLYPGFYWNYGAFIIIVIAGIIIFKKITVLRILIASLSASIIFYIISNFGVWFSTDMYPKSTNGLIACYIAGLPFLKNTVAGDLFYSGTMFGLFELAMIRYSKLRIKA